MSSDGPNPESPNTGDAMSAPNTPEGVSGTTAAPGAPETVGDAKPAKSSVAKKWYIVHTYSGQEARAKQGLIERAAALDPATAQEAWRQPGKVYRSRHAPNGHCGNCGGGGQRAA